MKVLFFLSDTINIFYLNKKHKVCTILLQAFLEVIPKKLYKLYIYYNLLNNMPLTFSSSIFLWFALHDGFGEYTSVVADPKSHNFIVPIIKY